jgi:hypothetical protein
MPLLFDDNKGVAGKIGKRQLKVPKAARYFTLI